VGEACEPREVRDGRDDGDLGASFHAAEEAGETSAQADHARDLTLGDLAGAAVGLVRLRALVGARVDQKRFVWTDFDRS
jgi:hypothetical protein